MNINEYLQQERENITKYITPKYRSNEAIQESISPSKKFKFQTIFYEDKGVLPNGGQFYHEYMNCNIFKDNKKIFTINGTTCFYTEWIEKENNESYLLSTEYYQGYGILNLNTLEYKYYLPEEAIEGTGFIWTKGYISPDKTKIAIEGCIWAWPYQIKIFDVTNPMILPYQTIFETNFENEYSEVIGWKNNNQFAYKDNYNEIIVKEL